MRNCTARAKSFSWIHETNWRPPAMGPPSAARGEVDDDVGAVDFVDPGPEGAPIPLHRARLTLAASAEHDDLVASRTESSSENPADLPGATWNDDLHGRIRMLSVHGRVAPAADSVNASMNP